MRRNERMAEHREGVGKLLIDGAPPVPVRYVIDTWNEAIATGSGTQAQLTRRDGFVWWERVGPQPNSATLELEDGRRLLVSLTDVRSNRAAFHAVREDA